MVLFLKHPFLIIMGFIRFHVFTFSKFHNFGYKYNIDFWFSPICSTDCTLQRGILNSTCKYCDVRLVLCRYITNMVWVLFNSSSPFVSGLYDNMTCTDKQACRSAYNNKSVKQHDINPYLAHIYHQNLIKDP